MKAKKAHEKRGLKALLPSFVFPASGSSPWCAFVVNIPVPGSFAYPVIEDNQGISRLLSLKTGYAAEEIYHEGEEGARKEGIEEVSSFLRVPGERQLALVRLCG
ncbi:MAG: hypothetical protein LBH51_01205 [Treponema sp.]|jgi:hypothetical protein|nr:hypothetical protein [Treponema sp.]